MPKEAKDTARTRIVNRYWQLADLPAEDTKGNIMGQLKALEGLRELTLLPAEASKTTARPAHAIYRAEWRDDPTGDAPPQ